MRARVMGTRWIGAGAVLLLTACAGSQALQGSDKVSILPAGQLPAPQRGDLFERDRPYLVGPFDKLTIDVFGVSDLAAREVQVDASGRLSYPLVGVIEAAGKTPGEIEEEMEQRLRRGFIRNPQVTVNLRETVSQVITVDGQVKEPGLYPVIGKMTLMRAVATAKGVDELAKLDDVVIFRTVNGQRFAALYNLKAIRRGSYDDPEVYANDIVVVGESSARRLFKDALSVLAIAATPIIVAIQ